MMFTSRSYCIGGGSMLGYIIRTSKWDDLHYVLIMHYS